MKKKDIALILFILIVPFITAYTQNYSDYEVTIITSSGITIDINNFTISSIEEINIGNMSMNNITIERGILYLLPQDEVVIQQISPQPQGNGGGFVPTKRITTPFYDLFLNIIKKKTTPLNIFKFFNTNDTSVFQDLYLTQPNNIFSFLYYKDDVAHFTIDIINRGDIPDKDATLKYYLLSPNNTIYKEHIQVFIEVPVTCTNGEYDIASMMCKVNNTYIEANAFTIEDSITLPINAELGDWGLVASYKTEVQEEFSVKTPFEVAKKINLWLILIIILILFITYIVIANKKGESNEKE